MGKIPAKIPFTEERELDFVSIAITDTGKKFILHIEFQTSIDKNILYRFSEYHGLLLKKYKLPIEQILVDLSERKINIGTRLDKELQFTGFKLIKVSELDPDKLLESQVPEQIIPALLANYKKQM